MIPEQLKLSILQSAFQGKLTGECVPNETADDLYQQIQSEKQELQTSIAEVGSYILEGKLNDGAFYESQMLFKTDYWDKHKHYFVRKMDSFSFRMFDEFYNAIQVIGCEGYRKLKKIANRKF